MRPWFDYMVQQIQQFHRRRILPCNTALSEDLMQELEEELLTKILEAVPAERRIAGLPPEELVAALSEEEAARVRELLERKQSRS